MGPRSAGNPPPYSLAPPRPPDLDEVRRKRIQIAKEQVAERTAAWRRELEKTMASFRSEIINELRQFQLERPAHQVMEPSGLTSSVPILYQHQPPPLLDDAISTQQNNSPASFFSVSGTNTSVSNPFNCHKDDCGGMSFVFGANDIDEKLENGESVEKRAEVTSGDGRGFSELECVIAKRDEGGIVEGKEQLINGMLEFHALQLFDKMPNSEGLCNARRTGFCNARRTIIASMSIPDKGGGLSTHRDIVDASDCIRDREAVAVALETSPNSIQEALSTLPSLYVYDAGLSENDVNTDWLKLDSEMAIYSNDTQSEAKRVQGFIRCSQLCHCEIKKTKPFCKEAFDGLGGLIPTSLSQVLTRLKLNFRDVRGAFESIMSCLLKLYHHCLNGKVGEENWPSDEWIGKMNRDANNWFDKWLRSETRLCGFQDATLREIFDAIHVTVEAFFQFPDKKISGRVTSKLDCKPSLESKDIDSKEATKPVSEHYDIFSIGCTRPPDDFEVDDHLFDFYRIFIEPTLLGHFSQLLPPIKSVSFSGFDKKVRDKGSGHILLTDDIFILNKEFVGNMRLLWVKFNDIVTTNMHTFVNDFLDKQYKCKIEGSPATRKQTELLSLVISSQCVLYTNQAGALIDVVKVVGEQLIAANPEELVVDNILRWVLHIVRKEDLSLTKVAMAGLNFLTVSNDEGDGDRDNYHVLSVAVVAAAHTSSSGGDYEERSESTDNSSKSRKLRHDVIEAAHELIQDIGTCHVQMAEQAVEHILHNDVILTLGNSKRVQEFLFAAKEKRGSFRVIVAEGAPRYQGLIFNGIEFNSFLVNRHDGAPIVLCSNIFQKMNKLQLYVEVVHKGIKPFSSNDLGSLLGDGNGTFYLVLVKNDNSTQCVELVFKKGKSCMVIGYDITDEKANVHIVRQHAKKAFDEKWVAEIAKEVVMDMTNARLYTTAYTKVFTGIYKTLQLSEYEIRNSDDLLNDGLARHFPHIKSTSTPLRYFSSSVISVVAILLPYVALVMCVTAFGGMITIETSHIEKVVEEAKKKQLDVVLGLYGEKLFLTILRQYGTSMVGKGFIYDILCLQLVLELIKASSTYESVTAARVHFDQFKAFIRGVQILTQNLKLEDKFLLRGLHCYENRLK